MKTDAEDTSTTVGTADLTPSDIFSILADSRRRFALHYLAQRVGAIQISDLAEQIALWENDLSRDQFNRIVTGLYHTQLPALREAGLINYDVESEEIERLPAADQLTPYLELALRNDTR